MVASKATTDANKHPHNAPRAIVDEATAFDVQEGAQLAEAATLTSVDVMTPVRKETVMMTVQVSGSSGFCRTH